MLISKDAKYIQATLSSQLFEFAYKKMYSSVELGQNGYQYNKHALIKLPLRRINEDSVNNNYYSDEFFYEIYGISPEEVKYIQESILSPQNQ